MTTRTAALRLQLLDQVSGPAKKTASALAGLEKDIGGLGRKGFPGAQNLGRQLDYLRQKAAAAGQFTELRRGTAAAFGEFRAARSRVEELRRSLATVTAPTAKMRADLRTAETALKSSSRAFREQRAATANASGALRSFGLNSRNAANAQREIRSQMAQTIQRMREMAREAKRTRDAQRDSVRPSGYGRSLGGLAATGTGGYIAARQLAAPVGKAMTFDETLTYVASTMAGGGSLEDKRAAKVRVSDAIDAALQAGGGKRDDAAAALNRLVASGAFEGDEALHALAPTVKTAHAAGATADDIAAMAVGLRNNGVQPQDLQRGFDAALKAGQLGGVELRDMARWLPQQLALARGSGMTGMSALEWLASANQVSLATAGSPDEASNNLVNLLQKLSSRELATTMGKVVEPDKGEKEFSWSKYMIDRQKEGVAPPEAFAEILDRQLSANEEYQRIQAGVKDAKTPEDRRALLEQAAMIAESSEVGQLIADRQALMAALALRAGKEKQKAIQAELATSGGTVDRESEFVRSQAWSKVQDGRNTIDRANEETFNALSGPLGAVVDKLNETARAFPELTTGAYAAGAALMAIATGGAVSTLLGGYVGGRGLRGLFGRGAAGGGAVAAGRMGLGAVGRLAPPVALGAAMAVGVKEAVTQLSADYAKDARSRPLPGPWHGFDDLSRRGRGDVDPNGVRYEGGRHRVWATGGPMPGEPIGVDPAISAQAAAVSAAASGGQAQKAGDTNVSAPVTSTVNQVFNGVTLEQTLTVAKAAAADVAKGVVAEFQRAMAAQLSRSSQIQYGGTSANGDW
jgi:hypothetical protein